MVSRTNEPQKQASCNEEDETTPLFPEKSGDNKGWTATDGLLLTALCFGVFGVIIGTYCWASLLAAFESDKALGWTPALTTLVNTGAGTSESIGLLIAGPIVDHFPITSLLGFEALTVLLGLMAIASGTASTIIVAILMIVCFKGLLWPCLGALISSNIRNTKHDASFLAVAISSRMGDISSSLLLGILLTYAKLNWREALVILSCLVAAIFGVAYKVFASRMETIVEPPGTTYPTAGTIAGQLKRTVVDLGAWLNLIILAGTFTVWSLISYFPIIFSEIYHQSPGQAAGLMATPSTGALCGLVTATVVAAVADVRVSRISQVLQTSVSVIALLALWTTVKTASIQLVVFLYFLVGFGFVVPSYLPTLLHVAQVDVSDRGFRNGVLNFAAGMTGVLTTFIFGRLREHKGTARALPELYLVTCLGMAASLGAMMWSYVRLDQRAEELENNAPSINSA
eukprot:TRINITY_DN63571_c0_g1_i1.p1 TRINITY_DN63571_c0_g1~~TRINITY_DN63571_c0_g1_i1.p1  ORF type:complete len:456 (+),score=51.57 TRINITY_DN63571_c0_g1_i1:158-1525(+)